MATPYPELNFRKRLYAISSKLSQHELKQLKYLVSEDLPTSMLERVKTPFELFCALEDVNAITAEKTDLLKVILDYAQRGHLMDLTVSSNPLPSVILNTIIQCSNRVLKGELLVPISNGLQSNDFHKLKCFFIKADEPKISYQEMEQMSSALDMFETLLKRNILTSSNLGLLWDVLMTIGRVDLCQKIEGFYSNPPAHTATLESAAMAPPTTLPFGSTPGPPSVATEATLGDQHQLVFSPSSQQHHSLEGSTSMESTSTASSLHSTPCSDGNSRALPGGSNLVVGKKRAYQHSERTEEEEKQERDLLKIIETKTRDLNRLAQQVKHLESATHTNTSFYPMQSKPHGLAIVFGNENFQHNAQRPRLILPHREATEVDIECFAKTFDTLGYQVHICKDFSTAEIKREVIRVMGDYHKDYDSIVLCFSSHGENDHFIFGSDGIPLDVYELVSFVQMSPELEGKPKMFFVQSCRVQLVDRPTSHELDGYPVRIPTNPKADLFIAWATSRLSPAYRSPTHGSWFPVALFQVFTESAQVHTLHTMMLQVTAMVCEIEGKSENESSARQCVETVERLRFNVSFQQPPKYT